jgi:hypothetical protein
VIVEVCIISCFTSWNANLAMSIKIHTAPYFGTEIQFLEIYRVEMPRWHTIPNNKNNRKQHKCFMWTSKIMWWIERKSHTSKFHIFPHIYSLKCQVTVMKTIKRPLRFVVVKKVYNDKLYCTYMVIDKFTSVFAENTWKGMSLQFQTAPQKQFFITVKLTWNDMRPHIIFIPLNHEYSYCFAADNLMCCNVLSYEA